MPRSRGLPAYFARIARETPKREQIVDTPASVFPRARVASWGTKSITGTARASSSLHQLAVWPPRTATRGNRWGDTHVGSAGGPEGASEAGVSGRFWPSWPFSGRCARETAKNGHKRPVDARWPRGRPVHASEPWVTSLLCTDRSRNAETRANCRNSSFRFSTLPRCVVGTQSN